MLKLIVVPFHISRPESEPPWRKHQWNSTKSQSQCCRITDSCRVPKFQCLDSNHTYYVVIPQCAAWLTTHEDMADENRNIPNNTLWEHTCACFWLLWKCILGNVYYDVLHVSVHKFERHTTIDCIRVEAFVNNFQIQEIIRPKLNAWQQDSMQAAV